ncbi:hypothetical protein HDV00_006346 [Rhizophlyctis rosea]|nr:hypothetical protein HDV00_006346 [Rhizophlyctis rosea]
MATATAPPPPLPSLTPQPPPEKRKVLVAKKVPPNYFGEDDHLLRPKKRGVPLSLLTVKNRGPRRAKDGALLEHTLLGDADDFAEMERLFGSGAKDASAVTAAAAAAEGGVGEKKVTPPTIKEQALAQQEKEKLELARRRQQEERTRWLNQLHIFQRYREVREEHALRNWKRHSIQWNRMEEALAKRSHKKTKSDLIMARLGEFRAKMEERDLIEEALLLLEQEEVNFWKTGLRIGNDLLGLTVPLPRGGARQIERLRTYEGTSSSQPASKYRQEKKQELRNVIGAIDPFFSHNHGGYMEVTGHSIDHHLTEEYIARLERRQSSQASTQKTSVTLTVEDGQPDQRGRELQPSPEPKPLDLHFPPSISRTRSHSIAVAPDFHASHAPHRRRLSSIRPTANTSSLDDTISILRSRSPSSTSTAGTPVPGRRHSRHSTGLLEAAAPAKKREFRDLVFASHRLSYETVLGEADSSVITVYNRGKEAFHFEWVEDARSNVLKTKAVHDNVQRFYFYHRRGVILPDTAFDFPIIFKSANPGIFTQRYKMVTTPRVPEWVDMTVTLQGMAIEPDTTYSKRVEIEKMLERRQATAAATEIINSILRNLFRPRPIVSATISGRVREERKRKATSREEEVFVKKNEGLHLYYTPKTFTEFHTLATETYEVLHLPAEEWDCDVRKLNDLIESIPVIDTRSLFLRRLNDAVAAAGVEPVGVAENLLYVIGSDILMDLADDIAATSEELRKEKGLPVVRSAAVFPLNDDAKEDFDFSRDASDRKPSPPVPAAAGGGGAAQAAPAGAAGAEAGKKGGAAAPAAKEPAGKKGAGAGATPAAGAAKGGAAGAAAGGKAAPKGAKAGPEVPTTAGPSTDQEEPRNPIVLTKLSVREKKPDSSRGWSRERQMAELEYKKEFKQMATAAASAGRSKMIVSIYGVSMVTLFIFGGRWQKKLVNCNGFGKSPLYWNVIDLRPEDALPLQTVTRGASYISPKAVAQAKRPLELALLRRSKLSPAVDLLYNALTLLAFHQDISLIEMGKVVLLGGLRGLVDHIAENLQEWSKDIERDVEAHPEDQEWKVEEFEEPSRERWNVVDPAWDLSGIDVSEDEDAETLLKKIKHLRQRVTDISLEDPDALYFSNSFTISKQWLEYQAANKKVSERTVDMYMVGPVSKVPGLLFE